MENTETAANTASDSDNNTLAVAVKVAAGALFVGGVIAGVVRRRKASTQTTPES